MLFLSSTGPRVKLSRSTLPPLVVSLGPSILPLRRLLIMGDCLILVTSRLIPVLPDFVLKIIKISISNILHPVPSFPRFRRMMPRVLYRSDFGTEGLMVLEMDVYLPVFPLIFSMALIVLVFGSNSLPNIVMRMGQELYFEAWDSGAVDCVSGIVVTDKNFQILIRIGIW